MPFLVQCTFCLLYTSFEPYEYYDGDNVVGIDADIAKAICDKLGYDLEIEDMEFDAIIAAVSSGKADFGAAGMTVKEDRLKNIDSVSYTHLDVYKRQLSHLFLCLHS